MAFFKNLYKKLVGDEDEEEETEMAEEEAIEEEETEYEESEDDMTEEKSIREPVSAGKSIELKIARLTGFDASVMEVADHLIGNRPVVLNLEEASKEASKRIIDFFSGVAYTVGGQLKSISNGIYIATPSNVDVSNDATAGGKTLSGQAGGAKGEKEENTSPYEGF